jgi:hypothetical protein
MEHSQKMLQQNLYKSAKKALKMLKLPGKRSINGKKRLKSNSHFSSNGSYDS